MDYATFSWARDRLQIIPMMWDQKENYAFNGFTLAFALNLPMANVAGAGRLFGTSDRRHSPASRRRRVPADKPDIIIVMSESFWDPTRLPGVTITPIRSRPCAQSSSGSMFSPEFGGMTANIEFEALTGFSNAFLPYGSIPYQQYVRPPVPSLATFLQERGLCDAGPASVRRLVLEPQPGLPGLRLRPLPVGGQAAAAGKARAAGLRYRLHRRDHPRRPT